MARKKAKTQAREATRKVGNELSKSAKDGAAHAQEFMKANPNVSVALALVTGVAIGSAVTMMARKGQT